MSLYEKRIREILAANISAEEAMGDYDADGSLQNIGMDSISFVAAIIDIENAFGIRFPEDKLTMSGAGTVSVLCSIVQSTVEGRSA